MPSILVRLRERARTLSFTKTATSASAPATPVPKTKTTTTTQTPTTTHAHPTTPTTTTTASQLDRRILANPDALLTSYENEVTHEQAHDEQRAHEHDGRRRGDRGVESVEIPVGLQPGPRRASGSGSVALARGGTAGGEDEVMHMVESGPQEQEEESGWESGEGRASAMEWSTFGRRHSGAGRTPRLNEFFFDQDAARDVDEKEKDASANGQHTGSSPCNTLSSRTPGTSHESPETFGMRTPVSRVDAHPALTLVLFPTVAESKDDAHEDAQRTYPRRRLRSWALRSGSSSQSLPSTLKLKRTKERTYPNIFRQFHVSPSRKSSNNIDASNLPNSTGPARSTSQSSKNRRNDKTPRRRASAEWYAFQASQNAEGQWPAQVSREILRLSGAGMVEVCATAGASSDSDAVIGPRSGHEASHLIIPLKPAGSDEARYRDGPSAHIALTKSQSLTQVSPASNHPDASCILSASGPSQPHGLFIDSASPNMAQQPQHEIFQFEKAGRGNGAESALAPKGNGRPQRRPRKPSASSVTPPAKPLQTAEYPPLHIPPSLSVTSPTPRNSAYPSSPTKESDTLQLPTALKAPSAKSQGKRKAEDGDTTPPDVKRATFAPIEPRSAFFPPCRCLVLLLTARWGNAAIHVPRHDQLVSFHY
ncbi:hypothetical protein FIBSPDRAFT_936879 [Athelia psychrophila]|uniref:Uncharacterized protein n=1 Tax=Athelia psychrophila TaxID=1759441 RepID=A0A166BCV1_9AGAM|nr:hypothetical protein FIBSPDRAFT_936879 [Fibularhizoctonia sp. CBS 109695]